MNKAHVDLDTGKIYGCNEGSFNWWHEKGHLVFNSNPKTSWLIMTKSYAFDLWMVFVMSSIVIRKVFPVALFLWLYYTSITIYEEWWCNRFASQNVIEWKSLNS